MKHFDELTSLRVIQSVTWVTASWLIGELSCNPLNKYEYMVSKEEPRFPLVSNKQVVIG